MSETEPSPNPTYEDLLLTKFVAAAENSEPLDWQKFWNYSRDFHVTSNNLPEGAGVVVELPGKSTDVKANVQTLIFDARRAEYGEYIWELTLASLPVGRDIRQLHLSPNDIYQRNIKTDHQGRLAGDEIVRDEPQILASIIDTLRLTQSPAAVERLGELDKRRLDSEARLSHFAVHGTKDFLDLSKLPKDGRPAEMVKRQVKLSPRAYEHEIADREAEIDGIGYVPLKPFGSSN